MLVFCFSGMYNRTYKHFFEYEKKKLRLKKINHTLKYVETQKDKKTNYAHSFTKQFWD